MALFDQSSFGKFLLEGPDALTVLNHICANDVAVAVGRIVYTQWLNERGGIEADVTVTRTGEEAFLVVGGASTQHRDFHWLRRHIPGTAHVHLADLTSAYAILGVMGPRSRELLAGLTDASLSNGTFPFASSQEIDLGYARVRASRITYVGELGWELYVPTEYARTVYDALVARGPAFGLRHAGYHAMDSLRLEKGYRHWGHDITDEDIPLEARLEFAVAFDKADDFIGREALLGQKNEGVKRRLVSVMLNDPESLIYHDEPIWRDGKLVGRVTSGAFGHTLGRAIGLGYIEHEDGVNRDYLESGHFEIEVACERRPAIASLRPFYDPKNDLVRS